MMQITGDETGDNPITLPLIVLARQPDISIQTDHKVPLSYSGAHIPNGYTVEGNPIILENGTVKLLNGIPIQIKYQLEIFTRYFEEADEYMRNFVYNLINYPKFQVVIPYNGTNYIHDSNIHMGNVVLDTSDVSQRLVPGQFTRWTIGFTVDDAYLFSIPSKVPYEIVIPEFDKDITKNEILFYKEES